MGNHSARHPSLALRRHQGEARPWRTGGAIGIPRSCFAHFAGSFPGYPILLGQISVANHNRSNRVSLGQCASRRISSSSHAGRARSPSERRGATPALTSPLPWARRLWLPACLLRAARRPTFVTAVAQIRRVQVHTPQDGGTSDAARRSGAVRLARRRSASTGSAPIRSAAARLASRRINVEANTPLGSVTRRSP